MTLRTPRAALLLFAAAIAAAATVVSTACGRVGDGPAPNDTGATARKAFEGFFRPRKDRVPLEGLRNPGTPWGDWVGSEACKDCHRDAYDRWRGSFHSRTLYVATEKTVFGDFSGATGLGTTDHAFTVSPMRAGSAFLMRVAVNPRATEAFDPYGAGLPPSPLGTFEVLYAFGNRRDQPYVVKAADGRHWIPPAVWNDREHQWTWDGWRPYVVSCAGCHVTGIRTGDRPAKPDDIALGLTNPKKFNVAPKDEGWADGSVGCENCHGPGKGHVDAVRRMGDAGYRSYLADGGAPTIYNPKQDTSARRMQQCDTCHTFLTESPVTFVPSPKGYDHDAIFEREKLFDADRKTREQVFNDAGYYPDRTNRSTCTAGLLLRESRMGKKGVECRDCHDAHGTREWAELRAPAERNDLCLRCHEADANGRFANAAAVAAHTSHKPDSPGSLCAECHMPRDKSFTSGLKEHGVVQFMSRNLHSHSMTSPTGHEADHGGPPSACNLCHVDRDAVWAQAWLRERVR